MNKQINMDKSPEPEFITDDDRIQFITRIKIHNDFKEDSVREQVTDQVTPQAERTNKILLFCKIPKARDEIQFEVNIKDREYFRKNVLKPLVDEGLLELTIPNKPNSSKQKYKITEKGIKYLEK
ncbi:MAG: Fic family protein [Nanobdellota archaeon]